MKPSRSDELLPGEDVQRTSEHVQEHFNALAPKRPLKPPRSEPLDGSTQANTDDRQPDLEIPEYHKLRDLVNRRSQPLLTEGGHVDDEDYVENDYYKDLIAAENGQHHTTGTGFIKVEAGRDDSWHVVDVHGNAPAHSISRTRSNPATNDWDPAPMPVFPASAKPDRSDP